MVQKYSDSKVVMKKINVAILGAGFISDIHVESYQRFVPEAEIVAIFSRDMCRYKIYSQNPLTSFDQFGSCSTINKDLAIRVLSDKCGR